MIATVVGFLVAGFIAVNMVNMVKAYWDDGGPQT